MPREPWVSREFLVLTHGGKVIKVRAESRPNWDAIRGFLKIGESYFYSVAAVLDPETTELIPRG